MKPLHTFDELIEKVYIANNLLGKTFTRITFIRNSECQGHDSEKRLNSCTETSCITL